MHSAVRNKQQQRPAVAGLYECSVLAAKQDTKCRVTFVQGVHHVQHYQTKSTQASHHDSGCQRLGKLKATNYPQKHTQQERCCVTAEQNYLI
jgi:hypothetical protein